MLSTRPAKIHYSISIILVLMLLAVSPTCRKPGYKMVVGKEGYTHMISRGETLESIAEKYYGERNLGKALGEYNNIDPLKALQPGTTLLVPFDTSELEKIRRTQEAYVYYNRGSVLARTGQYEEALRYLESAVEADPSHVDAWYNLALTYDRLEKSEKAIAILERLTDSYPSEKAYHYSLGASLRSTGKNKEALEAFERALDIDQGYREAQFALALTCEKLGKRKQAKREWERYLELDQDSQWSEEARAHLERLGGR
jgi:tetratricopeptide (TPR) repeat protein